jgi:hypothetical protein
MHKAAKALSLALSLFLIACGGSGTGNSPQPAGNMMGSSSGGSNPPPAPNPPGTPPSVPAKFELSLLRISDLEPASRSSFGNFGSDSLGNGEVEVGEEGNRVKVKVQAAMPDVTYNVVFCLSSSGNSNCLAVGSVSTDNQGQAETDLNFPSSGAFAGVFVLMRAGSDQFVTGFIMFSSRENEDNDEENETKFEEGLEPAGAVHGGLGMGIMLGTDALRDGSVDVENDRTKIELKGAPVNTSYSVNFCRFGQGSAGCFMVGSVSTDNEGEAEAELNFPNSGGFDGIFVLSRSVNGQALSEFVTGFKI